MTALPLGPVSVEFAPFHRRAGISPETLMEASDQLQQDLQHVPGFMGRMLPRENEDKWVDLVFWRSLADAKSAAETFVPTNAACKAYFACMAPESFAKPDGGAQHFLWMKTYGKLAFGG